MKNKILDIFAEDVFTENLMKKYLSNKIYKQYKMLIQQRKPLTLEVADEMAQKIRQWAMAKGATHFAHWFQPMTGITAEKHDSFLDKDLNNQPISIFTGRSLIKGEPDASSFPSGGIRTTFEARGYTVWDPTSYVFILNRTLYIPTAFCAYSGEALDKKTPLLKSIEVLNHHAKRVLKILDFEEKDVFATVGTEQEYFLIDKSIYESRPDLMICGRTLFGNKPVIGQEMDNHYFGKIKSRVASYMAALNKKLWSLGIYSKTEHNEVAPAQHELASVYTYANVATDNNQLVMALMKQIATEFDMVCLLHEKPFEYINGSGKHNNWSLATQNENLLEPGKNPKNNLRFLLFLVAIIKAVDQYSDLLRISVASASNDHRLGTHEAPPAIVSIFLGDELTKILDSIEEGKDYHGKIKEKLSLKVPFIPLLTKDTTDRNRTSPFAFTGNKFELRMVGSKQSIADPNMVLNTIVASVLDEFANRLENAENVQECILDLIKNEYKIHKKIIYNGNGYSLEWLEEAKNRGLLNLKDTMEALDHLLDKKNIDLFEKYDIFTERELRARYDILLENYYKTIYIEAETMMEMLHRLLLPGIFEYKNVLATEILHLNELHIKTNLEKEKLEIITNLCDKIHYHENLLTKFIHKCNQLYTDYEKATFCHESILPAMNHLRKVVDQLEIHVAKKYWNVPSYFDMLYSIKY